VYLRTILIVNFDISFEPTLKKFLFHFTSDTSTVKRHEHHLIWKLSWKQKDYDLWQWKYRSCMISNLMNAHKTNNPSNKYKMALMTSLWINVIPQWNFKRMHSILKYFLTINIKYMNLNIKSKITDIIIHSKLKGADIIIKRLLHFSTAFENKRTFIQRLVMKQWSTKHYTKN
jgi:hypothetical protein